MLRPFAHPVACCRVLLGFVAQSLKPVKLLATRKRTQQLPTILGVVGQQCCVRLHPTIQWVNLLNGYPPQEMNELWWAKNLKQTSFLINWLVKWPIKFTAKILRITSTMHSSVASVLCPNHNDCSLDLCYLFSMSLNQLIFTAILRPQSSRIIFQKKKLPKLKVMKQSSPIIKSQSWTFVKSVLQLQSVYSYPQDTAVSSRRLEVFKPKTLIEITVFTFVWLDFILHVLILAWEIGRHSSW